MRLRINFPFLFALLGGIVLFVAVAFGVNRYQVYRQSSALLDQAIKAEDEGDLARASTLLKRFLDLKPDSGEAHGRLGLLLSQRGDPRNGFFHLESALRLEPATVERLSALAGVAILLDRFTDARDHLTQLIEMEPQNPEHLANLAECYLRLGNVQEATTAYDQMRELAGDDPQLLLRYANFLTSKANRADEAERLLTELVARQPDEAAAHLALGEWLLEAGKTRAGLQPADRRQLLDRALASAERALSLSTESPDAALLLAEVATVRGSQLEVLPIVLTAIKTHPQVPELYGAAANIELARQDGKAAVQHLKDGLLAIPGQPDLLWNLAQLELENGNIDAVQRLIGELNARNYPEAPIRFLEARILSIQGKHRGAAEMLEKSRAKFDRSTDMLKQVDFLLAMCYRRLGNPDQELAALRRATITDPTWLPAREELATALMRAGRYRDAATEFENVVVQPSASAASQLSLARLLIINEMSQAEQADWRRAEDILNRVAQIPEAAADVAVLRTEILVASGKLPEAKEYLKEAIAASPESIGLRQSQIALHIRLQEWDQATQSLEAAKAALPDSSDLRLAEARLLLIRDGDKAELETLDRLASGDSLPHNEKLELATGMAIIFLSLEDFDRSRKQAEFVAVSEAGNESLAIHLLLFELAFRSSDLEQMSKLSDQVKVIEGSGPLWRVGEAIRRIVESEGKLPAEQKALLRDASNNLAEARVARPAWSRIPRLQAEIHERELRPSLAIDSYLEAIRLGEQSPELISRTVFLLYEAGRFPEAEEVVSRMRSQNTPLSNALVRVASQVSLELQNFDRALSWARDAVEQSGLPQDHIWLAQVYSIQRDYGNAEKEFRIAIEKEPESLTAWNSLVRLFVLSGDLVKARDVVTEAAKRLESQGTRASILAQCYQTIRDYAQAEKYYREALQTSPNDVPLTRRFSDFYLSLGNTERALPLLESLLRADIGASDLAWARRNVALVTGLATKDGDLKRVNELLAANVTLLGEETVEDQRVRAVILGERSDQASIQGAAKILEELANRESSYSLTDNFLRARLYARMGDWSRYNRTMLELMGKGGADEPQYVRAFADGLLKQALEADDDGILEPGQAGDAELWMNRLRKLSPNDLSTAELEAEMLFRSNDFPSLVKLFERMQGDDRQEVQRWGAENAELYALLAEEAGKQPEAKSLLAVAVKLITELSKKPEHSHLKASFLARQGRVDAAVQEFATGEWTPEQVADVGQSALQAGKNSDEALRKVITAIESHADMQQHVLIRLSLGDLYGWVGDWEKASAKYDEVLEEQATHLVALNNKAMLLGLHGQQLEQALAAIERALAFYGPRDYLLDTRGIVLLAQGKGLEAARDFSTALQANQVADRHFHLAEAQALLGQADVARASLEKAMQLGLAPARLHPAERPAFTSLLQKLNMQGSEL